MPRSRPVLRMPESPAHRHRACYLAVRQMLTEGGSGDVPERARVWVLRRNCALTPRQVGTFYASLVLVSTLIAAGFAINGAWMVLPFSCAEVLAVGIALVLYARHATDHERVCLDDSRLVVEVVSGGDRTVTTLDRCWTRVCVEAGRRAGVFVACRGRRVPIGRFVGEEERRRFAKELSRALTA